MLKFTLNILYPLLHDSVQLDFPQGAGDEPS